MIPATFYVWLKPLRLGSNKCHLVGELNDGDDTVVVYKNWSQCGRRWEYFVQHRDTVEYRIAHNEGASGYSPRLSSSSGAATKYTIVSGPGFPSDR